MAADPQTTVDVVTVSGTLSFYATKDSGDVYTFQSTPRTNGDQVSDDNPLPVKITPGPSTPGAPSGALTLAIAATSQTLAAGGSVIHGGWIYNPLSLTQQGIVAAESAFVKLDGAGALLVAGGTTLEILPGEKFPLPSGITTVISWNAATVGHRISAVIW